MSELNQLSELETEGSHLHQYLTFVLKGEHYGININSVKEIIEYSNVTGIPLMPDFVKGVLNLRGDVVPVIDLSLRFGKDATEIQHRSCIVILEVPHEDTRVTMGVVVDAVNEVLEIEPSQIEPPPTFGAKIRAQFIQGVVNVGEQFVILLHGDKVLSVEEMAAIIDNVVSE
ncbi:putative chemotaxis protein CheW [Saliniradius amylolyticus]|uniref:Putative chemotaxis protein CheW n=1 Tax=Saliniradius amylolyticus TaxID=2183582 RepID=A0A2S2E638_9ALTE|nr:chemotaxis protein CheW [Saliniradius amylolyticus]AWL13124.1 putative chemotaxis protein CheW [Saliniradius amylolyticus]